MKSYLSTHLTVAFLALVCAVLLTTSAWYIRHTTRALESALLATIDEQTTTIRTLALLTDRNGADELTERIIADCANRDAFEDNLSRLDTLSQKDLLVTQQLYESCGRFYVERKALMVSRLRREYDILDDTLKHLLLIRDLTPQEEQLHAWSSVIDFEEQRGTLLAEQADIQAKIIESLISSTPDSKESIKSNISRAVEIQESLQVIAKQIAELRKPLE